MIRDIGNNEEKNSSINSDSLKNEDSNINDKKDNNHSVSEEINAEMDNNGLLESKNKKNDAIPDNNRADDSLDRECEEIDTHSLLKRLKEKREELKKQSQQIDELKDLIQRRQADFENYKKRVVKSQDEYRKTTIKDMALDVIKINDDLHRAMAASEHISDEGQLGDAYRSFVEGVSIISRQIEDMLKKYGVVEIDSLNREFNPNLNEAVEIDESEDVSVDTITKVHQKGFVLDDLVIRSAKVKVTRPAKKTDPASVADNASSYGNAVENGENSMDKEDQKNSTLN